MAQFKQDRWRLSPEENDPCSEQQEGPASDKDEWPHGSQQLLGTSAQDSIAVAESQYIQREKEQKSTFMVLDESTQQSDLETVIQQKKFKKKWH